MAQCQFAVVSFVDSNTVDVAPVTWVSPEEDYCYWPPCKGVKVAQLVKERQTADRNWKQHAVKVLGTAGLLYSWLLLFLLKMNTSVMCGYFAYMQTVVN